MLGLPKEGLDGSAIDTDYDARCMDLCTDAGFAPLVCDISHARLRIVLV